MNKIKISGIGETISSRINDKNRIPDSYPKYVISATPLLHAADFDGVTHLSLRKFLTEGLGNDGKTMTLK